MQSIRSNDAPKKGSRFLSFSPPIFEENLNTDYNTTRLNVSIERLTKENEELKNNINETSVRLVSTLDKLNEVEQQMMLLKSENERLIAGQKKTVAVKSKKYGYIEDFDDEFCIHECCMIIF